MKVKTLDSKLIDLLEEKYGSLWWPTDMYPEDSSSDPFKHLIITILSQIRAKQIVLELIKVSLPGLKLNLKPSQMGRRKRSETVLEACMHA